MKIKLFLLLFLCFCIFANTFAQEKKKLDVNDKIANEFTDAAMRGQLEIIKSMLSNKVDIDIYPNRNKGWTALMAASTFGKTEIVKYLISKGANVNVKLEDGETTLIQSAQNDDNKEIVKELLKADVEINAQTKKGLTALMRFAWMGQSEAVKMLLDAGADTKLKNENGWTAFYFACSHGNDEKIVKYLLDAGANPNETDLRGRNPLMWIGWGERAKNFKVLITAGTNVNAKDSDGVTPLMISSARLFYNEVNILLDAKADVKAQDKNGWNALMRASASSFRKEEVGAHGDGFIVWLGATKIIEKLISAGIDVNTQNNKGETALMLAIKAKNAHFAETLLSKGADSKIKDKSGKTAFDYADKDYYKVKESLLGLSNKTNKKL